MTAEPTIGLPSGDGWTWDDLQAVPDDRCHYFQLIEGQILMSPSSNYRHQTSVLSLLVTLTQTAPHDLQVLVVPFDFVPEPTISLQPDVLVLRRGTMEKNRTVAPPVPAIEVLSPRRRTVDLTTKRELYARFGVPHYWIVDPDAPSILALELGADGNYAETATVTGAYMFATSKPFPVEFCPPRSSPKRHELAAATKEGLPRLVRVGSDCGRSPGSAQRAVHAAERTAAATGRAATPVQTRMRT